MLLNTYPKSHSYGGVLATHLSKRLEKDKINISLLVTVDAAAGPESNKVDRKISNNVSKNINIYQTNPSAIFSRGDKNSKANKSNAEIVNVDLTKLTNEHGKIDDVSLKAVINQILKEFRR